jgi:2-polyprenyl-3-methyl-5-hydroxy-6-metoxy-1,4-benzoquinol methylase
MWQRLSRAIRYRLGRHVLAPLLEDGTDEDVRAYYNSRLSDCSFLADPQHYERPRIDWMLARVKHGAALEVGCADGTMTAMLASRVDHVTALDLCQESIERVRARRLPNVEAVSGFVETFEPCRRFDWILMSEVLEHLRDPCAAVTHCLRWLTPGGSLLLSTPEGSWEGDSIEHLHVFTFESWCVMLARAGCRDLRVFSIPDGRGVVRWLSAEAKAGWPREP